MDPAKEAKLLFQVTLLQGHHKAHKANGVQSKADHSVIRSKWEQICVSEYDMLVNAMVSGFPIMKINSSDLEIVDDTFAIEEIIRHREEIPI
jgi:hypothetical protein